MKLSMILLFRYVREHALRLAEGKVCLMDCETGRTYLKVTNKPHGAASLFRS
jgi:hypothetical protein